jgi:glycosyltransferase involved in cell wall biosynthesis
MDSYTLGIFANVYPAYAGDHRGLFIKKMVDELRKRKVIVKTAVKIRSNVFGYFRFYYKSFELMLDPSVDIFQAHYIPHSSFIPAILKNKKPLVLKFHGSDGRVYPYKNPINKAITRYMLKRADKILTISEELKKNLICLGAPIEKISVLSSGVDTSHFLPINKENCRKKLGLPLEKFLCLYIGWLIPSKGIAEIIKAAYEQPEIIFILAGPGSIPPLYPKNCLFTGDLNHQEVKYWINAADVSILPSYTEGISNFIMESFSCEVPVIATQVGGTPEIVHNNENGLFIPAKNHFALSQAIYWMKEHENERKTMGKKGRSEMIEQYDGEKLIDRLIGIHQELIL